jgi:hypothetical protein
MIERKITSAKLGKWLWLDADTRERMRLWQLGVYDLDAEGIAAGSGPVRPVQPRDQARLRRAMSTGSLTGWPDTATSAAMAASSTASRPRPAAKQRRLRERRGKAVPARARARAALLSKEGHLGPVLRDECSVA